jgi:hypothetical protein
LGDVEAEVAIQAAVTRGLDRMRPRQGAFHPSTGNQGSDGAGQLNIRREAAIAGGNWDQPARTIDERCHAWRRGLDRVLGSGLQTPSDAAGFCLILANGAPVKGNILRGVAVGANEGGYSRVKNRGAEEGLMGVGQLPMLVLASSAGLAQSCVMAAACEVVFSPSNPIAKFLA